MPRHFTLDQALRLLPRVEEHIRRAVHLKQEHDKAEGEFESVQRRIQMMGGMVVNREKLAADRTRRDALSGRLREIIEEIHGWGCQIKDLDTGLCDFPTMYRGEEVLLCWRLGETTIEYWHGTTEGFRGRKPIDDHFKRNHRGDLLE